MTDPQELANKIGADQRSTEAALRNGDIASARKFADDQHQNLIALYAYVRDELGIDLDWDAIAGNNDPAKAVARGGGAKDPPPSEA